MSGLNLLQVYTANPITTNEGGDLMYFVRGNTIDVGMKYSDFSAQFPVGSSPTTIYISNSGSDVTGDGTISKPYASLTHALASITPSSSIPYLILPQGIFSETNLALKPWCSILGNDSASLTITGSVTLDSSWSSSGESTLNHFYNIQFPATVTLDFDSVGAASAVFNFSNNLMNGSCDFSVIGNSTSGTILLFENNINFGSTWNITVTNCYGAIDGGDVGNITVNHSSETAGGNFNVINSTIEGNFSLNDTTTSAGMSLFHEQCKVIGNTTYASNGSALIEVFAKGMTYFNPPTIDYGTSGGAVQFFSDYLTQLPALLNGAGYEPNTIADAIKANYYFNPVNFIGIAGSPGQWVADSVTGYFAGIDAVLGTVSPGTPIAQQLWVNAVNGNDSNSGTLPNHSLQTYDNGAYPIILANASPTNPYVVYIIGDSSVTSNFNVLPYCTVIIIGGLLTIPGEINLDSSYASANNAFSYIDGQLIADGGISLTYGSGDNNLITLNIDPTTTPSISATSPSGTNNNGVIVNIIPNANIYTGVFSSSVSFQNLFVLLQNFYSNIEVYLTSLGAANCGIVLHDSQMNVQLILDGTGGGIYSEIQNTYTANLELINTNVYCQLYDDASYPFSVTLSGGALISQIGILGSTDGLPFSINFVPSNFSLIGNTLWNDNSTTAAFAGIDAKLANVGSSGAFTFTYDSGNSSGISGTPVLVYGSYFLIGDYVNVVATIDFTPTSSTPTMAFEVPFVSSFPLGYYMSATASIFTNVTPGAGAIGLAVVIPTTTSVQIPMGLSSSSTPAIIAVNLTYKYQNF